MNSTQQASFTWSVHPAKYFVTDSPDLKNVRAAPALTFRELACLYIENPAKLPVDQTTFLAMDETEQWKMMHPPFIIPATFNERPFNLQKDDKKACNLLALKIDTRSDALLYSKNHGVFATLLKGVNLCVYRSPHSTPGNPCLIVLIEAESIPQAHYSSAVKKVAKKLRLKTIGDACLNPLTAFPLPVIFAKRPFLISKPWLQ